MSEVTSLILASGSPRRSEFLLRAGIVFDVVPADIDETQGPGEPPATYAARLADEKAATVRARRPEAWVLAADTIVVEGGEVLGKPDDGADAARMLARLAGRRHTVMTATCLAGPAGERVRRLIVTEVAFRALPADEIASYVESGEWQGKAGGYGIQGRAAAFVAAVVGSYTSVAGLPLSETLEDLAALGLARPRYR
jgi:septum formation protein